MAEKILGYGLIAVGIILILAAAFSVFAVFTGSTQPVNLFKFSGISLDLGSSLLGGLPAEMTKGIKVSSSPTEILPAEMINTSANIFAHLMFMGFIAGIGQKLASIGTQLVRPIVVKLNEQK
jgi:hypothetical protein